VTLVEPSVGNAAASYTVTGTYSMGANCLGSANLVDSTGKTSALNLSMTGAYGQGVNLIEAHPQFVRSGAAHATGRAIPPPPEYT